MLARREHSRAELARKLGARLIDVEPEDRRPALQAELQQALDDLERHGLLSDRRAADTLLQAKASRYGGRRLQQMMQARSFAPELVAETLAQARSTEFERALEVWRRRFGAPPQDLKERARQQRFLAGRGFDAAVIGRVLKTGGAEDD